MTWGTILEVPVADGFDWRYLDPGGRLVRIEKRDRSAVLRGGDCTVEFVYDTEGRVAREGHSDASGRTCRSAGGYAVVEHRYAVGSGGSYVEETELRDEGNQIVCGSQGWATARIARPGRDGYEEEITLFDERGMPAAAVWNGVTKTARVAFVTIEGVGKVRCAVHYDASGAILARKVVSGITYREDHAEYTQTYR
jgi:hypothetical protein